MGLIIYFLYKVNATFDCMHWFTLPSIYISIYLNFKPAAKSQLYKSVLYTYYTKSLHILSMKSDHYFYVMITRRLLKLEIGKIPSVSDWWEIENGDGMDLVFDIEENDVISERNV